MDQIQVLDNSVMMAEGIFEEVVKAIKTRHPNLFVHLQLDQRGFEHMLKRIHDRMNLLETYSFR